MGEESVAAELGEQLSQLAGVWRGSGVGDYPTIDRFEYDEVLRFELGETYPLLHFEQRTTKADGEPSHWESGFVRWSADGTVEVSIAQDSGRVEVMAGSLTPAGNGWTLEVEAKLLGNDERLVHTRRIWSLAGEVLSYVMEMSTTTTDEPAIQQHLRAELRRSRQDA